MKNKLGDHVFDDTVNQKQRLIEVKAQVMRWDSSTRLWGQCVGGGLSQVTLYEIQTQENINTLQPKSQHYIINTSSQLIHPLPEINTQENSNIISDQIPSYETCITNKLDATKQLSAVNHVATDPLMNLPEEPPTKLMPSFKILAHRISDRACLIDCNVEEGLEYSRTTHSMLHHWSLGDRRFGLTFQSSHEASLFQQTVLNALKVIKGQQDISIMKDTCRLPTSPSLPLPQTTSLATPSKVIKSSSSFFHHPLPPPHPISLVHRQSPYNQKKSSSMKHHKSPSVLKEPLKISPSSPVRSSLMKVAPPVQPPPPPCKQLPPLSGTTERMTLPPPRIIHTTATTHYHKPRAATPPSETPVILLSSLHTPQRNAPSPLTLDNFKYNDNNNSHHVKIDDDDDDENIYYSRRQSITTESYVHLTKDAPTTVALKHDYTYPMLPQSNLLPISLDILPTKSPPKLPWSRSIKTTTQAPICTTTTPYNASSIPLNNTKYRCKYCQEYVSPNDKQRCKAAPDKRLNRLQTLTCYHLLRAALYHCAGDAGPCRRGLVTALMAMLLPCLCLYPLLSCLHCRCSSSPPHQRDINH